MLAVGCWCDVASDLWSIPAVTVEEVRVAWNRFRLLNPDEYGFISRDVFRQPPYSSNIFCKQVGIV